MHLSLIFLLRCHQEEWKEVKRIFTYRDERNQEKRYPGLNLSLNFWKPKGRWERNMLSGGSVVSM